MNYEIYSLKDYLRKLRDDFWEENEIDIDLEEFFIESSKEICLIYDKYTDIFIGITNKKGYANRHQDSDQLVSDAIISLKEHLSCKYLD